MSFCCHCVVSQCVQEVVTCDEGCLHKSACKTSLIYQMALHSFLAERERVSVYWWCVMLLYGVCWASSHRIRPEPAETLKSNCHVLYTQVACWRIHTRQFCQRLLFPTQPLNSSDQWLSLMSTAADIVTSPSGTGSRLICQMCCQSSLIERSWNSQWSWGTSPTKQLLCKSDVYRQKLFGSKRWICSKQTWLFHC